MSVAAEEFQTVSKTLYHWSAYDPAVKTELSCTAFLTPAGFVVFNPLQLADAAWKELLAIAPLRALVLTNANHLRDAEALRKKHKVPVAASPATKKNLEGFKPEIVLMGHEMLYGFSSYAIEGAAPGETAFCGHGLLVLGDAVINVDSEKGMELLPDKYCENPKQNRASLQKLLALDFHTITFAHGNPVTSHAKEKLTALLQS